MKIQYAKYFMLLLFLASCNYQQKELKEYGYTPKNTSSIQVPLRTSDFNTYGTLIERIREIVCHDSIPSIIIEDQNTIRKIYPIEHCEIKLFHPRMRNTFFIHKDSIFKNEHAIPDTHLKDVMIQNYQNKGNDPENASSYEQVLFIVEYYENRTTDSIDSHLKLITKSYDAIKGKKDFKITFWPKIDVIQTIENGQLK